MCTITTSEREQKELGLRPPTNTRPRAQAARILADIPAALDNFEKTIKKAKQDLQENKISQAEYDDTVGYARLTSKQYIALAPAYRACAEGKPLSQAAGEAQSLFVSVDGKGLNEAGIGITVAGVVVVVLGLLAAALPQIKPLLPGEVQVLLP